MIDMNPSIAAGSKICDSCRKKLYELKREESTAESVGENQVTSDFPNEDIPSTSGGQHSSGEPKFAPKEIILVSLNQTLNLMEESSEQMSFYQLISVRIL
jgi:hypothetical protein